MMGKPVGLGRIAPSAIGQEIGCDASAARSDGASKPIVIVIPLRHRDAPPEKSKTVCPFAMPAGNTFIRITGGVIEEERRVSSVSHIKRPAGF